MHENMFVSNDPLNKIPVHAKALVTGSPRSGMSLPADSGIYEIRLIADGHQLQVDTIVAASIDSAKRIYEDKYGVTLANEQYQAVRIGDVV